MKRTAAWTLGILVVSLVLWRWLPRGASPVLGASQGKLLPCPDSPNAVSSQSTDPRHAIAPLPGDGTAESAMERCRAAVLAEPGTRIVTESPGYLRAEAVTPWMRFVDDLEFLHDKEAHVIHVRSASRIGYSDLGTNRRRIERIRVRMRENPTAP